jgi:hypothetical protein
MRSIGLPESGSKPRAMSTMNISLPDAMEVFVDQQVAPALSLSG